MSNACSPLALKPVLTRWHWAGLSCLPAEDGKICVLDFGLMTEVTPTQRIALFEYIAHLTIQVGTAGCSGHSAATASTSTDNTWLVSL